MNAYHIYTNTVLPQLLALIDSALQKTDEDIHELALDAEDDQEQNQHYEVLQQLRIQRHSVLFRFQEYWLSEQEPQLTKNMEMQVSSLGKLLSRKPTEIEVKLSNGQDNKLSEQTIIHSFLIALTHTHLPLQNNVLILRQFEYLLEQQLSAIQQGGYQALAELGIQSIATSNDLVTNRVQAISKLYLALEKLKNNYRAELPSLLQRSINSHEAPDLTLANFRQELKNNKLYAGPINDAEQQALNAINHLFSLIMEQAELHDKAKQIILWLQLPYSCIALSDKRFLANSQTLAHFILEELIQLARQWQNYEQTAQLAALQQKLIQTVLSLWRHPLDNDDMMQQILYDLLLYNDDLKQQQSASAKQEKEQHTAKKAQEIIHQQIDEVCYQALSGAIGPILSSELINQGWKHLLYLVASKYGIDSSAWHKAVTVLEDLGDSLQAPENYSSRTSYLAKLPFLLKRLSLGLGAVQSPSQTSEQLETLAIEHKKIVEKIADLNIDDEQIKQAREEAKTLSWQLFEDETSTPSEDPNLLTKEQVDSSSKEPESTDKAQLKVYAKQEEILDQLGPGSELSWKIKGKAQRLRIAAYIKHTDQYILIYPDGNKAAEFNRAEMLDKLRAGELESLDTDNFFNDALATVIHNMRQQP